MMSAKQTIAVIGASGNRGAAISKILAKGNNRLLLIANEKEKVENVAQYITNNTASAEVEVLECPTDASWEADLIILAVPYQVEKEIAEKIREVANQKVVISLNNSYNSSQEALQNLLPNSKVVKATLEEIQSIIQNNK
jgi:predicted dinucleotide-binding enzyme